MGGRRCSLLNHLADVLLSAPRLQAYSPIGVLHVGAKLSNQLPELRDSVQQVNPGTSSGNDVAEPISSVLTGHECSTIHVAVAETL